MKITLVLIFSFLYFIGLSQTYNTKIGTANKVEVKEGKAYISKADTVVIIVYMNKEIATKIYVNDYQQIKDSSSGTYITTIGFINKELTEYIDVTIELWFSSPVLNVNWNFPVAFDLKQGYTKDKKATQLKALRIVARNGFKAEIISKEKIKTEIKGISGYL